MGYWTKAPAPGWPPAKPHSLPQGLLHMAAALVKLSKVIAERGSWWGTSTILHNVNMEAPFHHGPLEASHKPCQGQRRPYKGVNMIGGYVGAPKPCPTTPHHWSCLQSIPCVCCVSPWSLPQGHVPGLPLVSLGSSFTASIYCACLRFSSMP